MIGAKVAAQLRRRGIEHVAASRATGVNTFTGEGLARALDGADVVIDVTNSSYTDYAGAEEFFATSTLNLLSYGAAAGVSHHIALSVVGTDRLAASEGGYFTAKLEQERLIQASRHRYSIVHATQFFEFLVNIAESATRDGVVRVAHARVQPMAADDVAEALLRVAVGEPTQSITEFAGPEQFRLDSVVRTRLWVQHDARQVVADPLATYFGTDLTEDELLPGPDAVLMPTRFDDWIRHAA